MGRRVAIDREPEREPDEAERAGRDERRAPAPGERDPRHDERREDAPTLLPALKIPTASARSRFGNHSATVFTEPGKFPDSPRPSAARAAPNPTAEPCERVRHRRDAPHDDRDRESLPRPDPVERPAHARACRMPYARLNHDTMSPYSRLAPMQLALQRRRENAEHLAIDVVDRRRREEQRDDRPPVAGQV